GQCEDEQRIDDLRRLCADVGEQLPALQQQEVAVAPQRDGLGVRWHRMRIIAGSRKGHTIHAPPGRDTRPTSDRVRENVFNIVSPVDGAIVLDLYAGSGGMGLEALSRGAAQVVFVDDERDAVHAIERNLDKLRLRATVLQQDAVAMLASEKRKYDLVLVDP